MESVPGAVATGSVLFSNASNASAHRLTRSLSLPVLTSSRIVSAFDDCNFFGRQFVEFIDETVDLAVERGAFAFIGKGKDYSGGGFLRQTPTVSICIRLSLSGDTRLER
jgi:hypothetical protein